MGPRGLARIGRLLPATLAFGLTTISFGGAFVYTASVWRLERTRETPPWAVAVAPSAGASARGERLARLAQCNFCHGEDLAGTTLADTFALGRLDAPNLTRGSGGLGASYSDADYERAIRRGRDPGGRPLLLMPSQYLRHLDDAELADLIAYLRSVRPVDRVTAPRRVGPLSRLVLVLGGAPDLIAAEQIEAAPRHGESPTDHPLGPGERLVALGACRVCHHPDLRGGRHPLAVPGEPDPPDISASGPIAQWSPAEFVTTLRTGRTPTGRPLDPRYMPWPSFATLTDAELESIHAYLTTAQR